MTVALGGACVNGAFTLAPLEPGFVYLGPTTLTANACRCSTVYYSLLSACAYCQNQTYLDWSIYDVNCTVLYNQVFTEPIPSSIVVPHYAYLDVVTGNSFSVVAAENAGGPESSSVPQATTTSSKTTVTSTAPAHTTAPSKKLNIGAIVGGVVGGIAGLVAIGGLIAFAVLRCRRPSVPIVPVTHTGNSYSSPQNLMTGLDSYNSSVPTTMTSGRIYNPNDPSTFPSNPNGASAFPSDPAGYSSYSGSHHSPQQVTTTFTGNASLGGTGSPQRVTPSMTGNDSLGSTARAQYTGAPEL